MDNWKKIAIIVGVVIVVGAIVLWTTGNWTNVVDNALCAIQKNVGIVAGKHFHLQAGYACN